MPFMKLNKTAQMFYELNANGQRRGQAAFNALQQYYPDIANELRGSLNDPFHKPDDHPAVQFVVELIH